MWNDHTVHIKNAQPPLIPLSRQTHTHSRQQGRFRRRLLLQWSSLLWLLLSLLPSSSHNMYSHIIKYNLRQWILKKPRQPRWLGSKTNSSGQINHGWPHKHPNQTLGPNSWCIIHTVYSYTVNIQWTKLWRKFCMTLILHRLFYMTYDLLEFMANVPRSLLTGVGAVDESPEWGACICLGVGL